MSKRLDFRISEEDFALLEMYCKKTGATKTGAIRMLIQVFKNEQLLEIVKTNIIA